MKTFTRAIAFLLSLSVAALLHADVEGTYSIDKAALMEGMQAMPEYAQMPEAQKQMMNSMFDQMNVSVVLADGGYSAEANMMGEITMAKGTYEVDGETLVVTTLEENGEAMAEPEVMSMTITDGKLMIQEEGMPFPMVLMKVK